MHGLVGEVAERHALGALEARRELGDREAIALATAAYAEAIWFFGTDYDRILGLMVPAWEEFADLEQTRAGVAVMLQLLNGYVHRDERDRALVARADPAGGGAPRPAGGDRHCPGQAGRRPLSPRPAARGADHPPGHARAGRRQRPRRRRPQHADVADLLRASSTIRVQASPWLARVSRSPGGGVRRATGS